MFGPYSRIDEVVGYVYAADLHCYTCIGGKDDDAERYLDQWATRLGIDRDDEYSFDTNDFPKPVYDYQVHDGCDADECWDRCGECGEPLGEACYAEGYDDGPHDDS